MVALACVALGFSAIYLRHDMAAALKAKPGAPQALSAGQVQVIDADTIRISGREGDIRLVGFSTPQTQRAQCDVERERGYTAMRRLRSIVESASLELQPLPCACPPNTEGTEACNAGRRCGILRANGWDIGERLHRRGPCRAHELHRHGLCAARAALVRRTALTADALPLRMMSLQPSVSARS